MVGALGTTWIPLGPALPVGNNARDR